MIGNGRWDIGAIDEEAIDGNGDGQTRRPLPSLLALRDLVASHPKMRPFVVDGLFREGEVGNIIASPKYGKSWLGYGLGLSVATGGDWLDTFRCVEGRVLILDGELHPEVIAHRIPVVADAMKLPGDEYMDRIDVVPLRGLGYDLISLAPLIRSFKPKHYTLTILDAWYRFLPIGISESDNAQVMSLYNRIDEYAGHLQSAWVNIHHATKGDQSNKGITDVGSGAGSQSRAADTHIIIRPHEEEGVSVIEAAVRSFPPVSPLAVRWSFPLWQLDSADPKRLKGWKPVGDKAKREEEAACLDGDRKEIVRVMVKAKELLTKSDLRHLVTAPYPRFAKAFESLTQDETIQRTKTKKGNNQTVPAWRIRDSKDESTD